MCALHMGIVACFRYALAAVILTLGDSASAQQLTMPDAPSHRFFDRQNTVAFSTLALWSPWMPAPPNGRPTPAWHMRRIHCGVLVRQDWRGEMATSALGYGAALGAAYTFHMPGHHKMERYATGSASRLRPGTARTVF